MRTLGFEILDIKLETWDLIPNIVVKATKTIHRNMHDVASRAKAILRDSMVFSCPNEERMWQGWCQLLDNTLDQ